MKKAWLGLALLAAACGGRPEAWDARVELPLETVGLTGSVAIIDPPLDRAVMITATGDRGIRTEPLRVGKNVATVGTSVDQSTLFVLARGVQPRRKPADERPSLTVIDGGTNPSVKARYTLTDPLQGLAVDPEGRWAVVYDAGGIVVNPNELIFVDLAAPESEPVSKTIRSFGGRPERLTFTAELTMPSGPPRRFLIVETEQDVALVDLSDLSRDEVTIVLPQTPYGKDGQPLQVAYHDGDPTDPNDARIAVRLANDSNVVLLELGPPKPGEDKPFAITPNVVDVGGVPSAIDFVQIEGGELRLAALVPTQKQAVLVEPNTAVVETVELDLPYSKMTRVTEDVAIEIQADIALLWSDQTNGIAFWQLGKTGSKPFRSVDPYDIGIAVSSVRNVPGEKFSHLKLLESSTASEFYVLDLDQRQSFPMLTNAAGFSLSVAPDGERAWALRPGSPEFASIRLTDLHPTSVEVERDVVAVYDILRTDGAGRAAIAIHAIDSATDSHAGVGATVLDALDPDTAESRFFGGLMLGGIQ